MTEGAAVVGGYRLIKTHLPHGMTPQNPDAKYVCVVRNPKDCVVSFFHHTRGFVSHYNFANGSFDDYFDLFVRGKVDFGDYFDCVRSWLDRRNDPNVLLLTYERLRSNTRDAVLELASFLGEEYPKSLVANGEEILDRVLRNSSLEQMKKDPMRWSSKRPPEQTPFIRKGSLGGWDELIGPEKADILDKKMREICSPDELDFLGDKY